MNILELQRAAAALLESNPSMRTLQIAQALNVTERDLVESQSAGIESIYLGEECKEVFKRIAELGDVMALTRNPWCVHERHGAYEAINVSKADTGIVLGPDIDLRMFFEHWGTVWLVKQKQHQSLQFFSKQGIAIHKVYVTETTDKEALATLIQDFQSDAQPPSLIAAPEKPSYQRPPAEFRDEWLALKDTHDFYPMLKKHQVHRLDALKAAGQDLAQQVSIDTIETLLENAVEQQIPIMVFVANTGMVQIHGGLIHNLKRTGPWYNILDPKFNLHLNTEAIDSLWVVNKPTVDGYVTSLEAYTADGELIVQFFGLRKPGIPEIPAWRSLLTSVCAEPLAV